MTTTTKGSEMSKQYETRNLTAEESAALVRGLTLATGKHRLAMAALGIIAQQGLGIFVAKEVNHEEPS
jgi:hypothetical protein